MVVALLYAMQSPCNCFTLSLSGSDSRKSNKLARRQRYYDGDQGVAPVMMVIVEDIDLRVTRQEGPGYSSDDHCQKPGAKFQDDGPEMGRDPDMA